MFVTAAFAIFATCALAVPSTLPEKACAVWLPAPAVDQSCHLTAAMVKEAFTNRVLVNGDIGTEAPTDVKTCTKIYMKYKPSLWSIPCPGGLVVDRHAFVKVEKYAPAVFRFILCESKQFKIDYIEDGAFKGLTKISILSIVNQLSHFDRLGTGRKIFEGSQVPLLDLRGNVALSRLDFDIKSPTGATTEVILPNQSLCPPCGDSSIRPVYKYGPYDSLTVAGSLCCPAV